MEQGNALYKSGNWQGALDIYTTNTTPISSSSQQGSDSILFERRSACLFHLQRYEEAETEAKRALALDPQAVRAYLRLAAVLLELGRDDEAEVIAENGLERNRNYAPLIQLREKIERRLQGVEEPAPRRYETSHTHSHEHDSTGTVGEHTHEHGHEHTHHGHARSHGTTADIQHEEHSHSHRHSSQTESPSRNEHTHSHTHTHEDTCDATTTDIEGEHKNHQHQHHHEH